MTKSSPQAWKAGDRVMDRRGCFGQLLATVWNGFAWIIYDGQTIPATVLTSDLALATEVVRRVEDMLAKE